jgi:hypothetical protein
MPICKQENFNGYPDNLRQVGTRLVVWPITYVSLPLLQGEITSQARTSCYNEVVGSPGPDQHATVIASHSISAIRTEDCLIHLSLVVKLCETAEAGYLPHLHRIWVEQATIANSDEETSIGTEKCVYTVIMEQSGNAMTTGYFPYLYRA